MIVPAEQEADDVAEHGAERGPEQDGIQRQGTGGDQCAGAEQQRRAGDQQSQDDQ